MQAAPDEEHHTILTEALEHSEAIHEDISQESLQNLEAPTN